MAHPASDGEEKKVTEYFHATASTYSVGRVLATGGVANPYSILVQPTHGWVNKFLDACAPRPGPTRTTCMYCCEDLGCCLAFAASDPRLRSGYRVYKVIPITPLRCAPMVLVDRIAKRGSPDPLATVIATEYWQPTRTWQFLEVLSDSIHVVDEVTDIDPMLGASGRVRYGDDLDLVKVLAW